MPFHLNNGTNFSSSLSWSAYHQTDCVWGGRAVWVRFCFSKGNRPVSAVIRLKEGPFSVDNLQNMYRNEANQLCVFSFHARTDPGNGLLRLL